MTTPLPNVTEALNAGGPPSVAWRNWFQSLNALVQSGELGAAELQAAIDALQAQVDALGGANIAQGEGIALYGSLSDTLVIALNALADSGDGELLAITRDAFGRVSGTKSVVAGDNITITDTGTEIELASTASGSGTSEILVTGAVGPVALTTNDETDWLYT